MISKVKLISGQSIIEIIIALALFVFIVSSGVVAILGAFTTTRLAEEQTQATTYATQGIEAVKSIRNQDWNNLVNGTYGLSNSGGNWSFSGTSDDPEGSGKFIRSVVISDVQRDVSNNIISSGGTIDDQTKHILVSVGYEFTPTRNNSVELETYLTNWQLNMGTGGGSIGPSEYQGENYSAQSGITVATNHAGYTGTGFADYGGNGTWLEWNFVNVGAGTATLTFRYANGSGGNRQAEITVNGNSSGNVAFPPTGAWTNWGTDTINVTLNSGNNTIRVTANTGSGGPNLDKMDVSLAPTTCSEYCISLTYTAGTCRANTNQCTNNGETYEAGGDSLCTGGGGSDTCCCAP